MDNEAVSLMLRRSFHFHEKKNSLQGRLYSKLLGTLYECPTYYTSPLGLV